MLAGPQAHVHGLEWLAGLHDAELLEDLPGAYHEMRRRLRPATEGRVLRPARQTHRAGALGLNANAEMALRFTEFTTDEATCPWSQTCNSSSIACSKRTSARARSSPATWRAHRANTKEV